MLNRRSIPLLSLLAVLALAATPMAQTMSTGPDVIVGAITGPSNYSSQGTIDAFSIGTTSCNIGDTPLLWISNTNQHPVIGQALYRLKDGHFDQIGMSWLKHGFFALQGSLCMSCTPNPNGSALGVGCSDPYGSSLNGSQSGLGPRSEVNAATGIFPYPWLLDPPYSGSSIARRLQVHHADLDPALNAGALYFAEAQYVTGDDAAAGNKNNNCSYRQATISGGNGEYTMALVGNTVREKQAIEAWAAVDPTVQIHHEDIPNDGRVSLAFKVIDLGGGMREYVYAVHNMNSDRSVAGFSVALPPGSTAQNLTFHDVDYHSGEPYSGTDWTPAVASNGVSWNVTQTYAQNPNANALRWGTTYTFSFQSAAIPGDITLTLFKPGTPTSVTIPALPIPQPSWQTNQPAAHLDVDGATNDGFVGPIQVEKISNTPGVLNLASTQVGQPWDIFMSSNPGIPNLLITGEGQIVNVDLSDPSLTLLNGGFGSTFPLPSIQIPFVTPNVTALFALQMAVMDPTRPDGISISALNEIDAHPAPSVMVEADGNNSYNSSTNDGYWKITHNGNVTASITSVVFSFAGTSISSRYFDTDQTGMNGVFNQGGTYRNGSDVAAGLDYSVSAPFAGSGWIGSDIVNGASLRTVQFDFTGGLFHGLTFEFDADTDSGPSSQNGASQAGMSVQVTMSDGTVHTGNLAVDPANPNRSFVEFF